MTAKALIQRIHLWSGLILGIQVLLWMASGAVMSWFPIELVRGETSAFSAPQTPLDAQTYASPGGIIAQAGGATSLELRHFLGRPAYLTRGPAADGLYDAASGQKLTPLNEATARRVAAQDYVGSGQIVRAMLVTYPPKEYRGERPVWRIDYNDRFHTRLYISPTTGEVRARRNDIWRLYDFFWMLHIMDYDGREDFNNPLLITASTAGLIFALSGIVIVIYRLRRGRYGNDLALMSGKSKRARKLREAESVNDPG